MAYAVRKDVLALETDPKQTIIIIIGNNQWISHTDTVSDTLTDLQYSTCMMSSSCARVWLWHVDQYACLIILRTT